MRRKGVLLREASALRLLLVSLLFLAPGALAGLGSPSTHAECGWYDGLGEACRVEGGFELTMSDGTKLFTHGLDPLPSAGATLLGGALAPPRQPPCIDEPLADYHGHFIYAHVADLPDRSAELAPQLRALVAEANGLLYAEGAELGAPVQYRFLCDGDGSVHISVASLPFPRGTADYLQTVEFLRASGYLNPHAKYWLFVDDPSSCDCAGVAVAPLDSVRSPLNNANGAGGIFGANYGYLGRFGAEVSMHENGHNLGAVNTLAPDSSGAGHCNDGLDIMCYADDGSNSSYTTTACADRVHFDCDHDTYFHPDPPTDSYVARNWQLGAPIVRFVEGCMYGEGRIASPGSTAELAVPAACQGHVYAIYGADSLSAATIATALVIGAVPVDLHLNVFSVCWYAGAVELACPANDREWGHEGRVPPGADRAIVRRVDGPLPAFTLSVI